MSLKDKDISKACVLTHEDDEFSIPLCMNDILTICREYNKLGYNIQSQIDNIVEMGVEEAIQSGAVKRESLPGIKYFLKVVSNNPYFGDAASIADDCYDNILVYEEKYKVKEINLN